MEKYVQISEKKFKALVELLYDVQSFIQTYDENPSAALLFDLDNLKQSLTDTEKTLGLSEHVAHEIQDEVRAKFEELNCVKSDKNEVLEKKSTKVKRR